ncbi:MAG: hypothetical protein R3Y43_07485 [Alphaproteobacteria bacterium]
MKLEFEEILKAKPSKIKSMLFSDGVGIVGYMPEAREATNLTPTGNIKPEITLCFNELCKIASNYNLAIIFCYFEINNQIFMIDTTNGENNEK